MIWLELLPFFITQILIIVVPIVGNYLKNRPEINRIKQQIKDKKDQVETNKSALISVACSKLTWEEKEKMIEFYKEELNKLKKEIVKLNNELPVRQRESIKLNVTEILEAVNKLNHKGGK